MPLHVNYTMKVSCIYLGVGTRGARGAIAPPLSRNKVRFIVRPSTNCRNSTPTFQCAPTPMIYTYICIYRLFYSIQRQL